MTGERTIRKQAVCNLPASSLVGLMREIHFTLHINADEMLRYYRGAAQSVLARTDQGLRVQFPAEALRPFVTKDGVHGRFALRFDANNKLAGIRKL